MLANDNPTTFLNPYIIKKKQLYEVNTCVFVYMFAAISPVVFVFVQQR